MKKSNLTIVLIFSFILLLFLSIKFKNTFNLLLEKLYFTKDKEIVIKDELTKTYIKNLENEISNYKEITNLENCESAGVIYREPTMWYDKFTINKSFEEGNLVINEYGLVGLITKKYKDTSEVTLLTNIEKKITVKLINNEKEVYGILSKYDKYKNEFIVSELTSNIDIKDTRVVTTSFTNTYKEGLLIGEVKDIKINSNGLSYDASVKPIVDFNNIKYVCVIK